MASQGSTHPTTQTATEPQAVSIIDTFVNTRYTSEHWEACAKQAQNLLQMRMEAARDANNEEIQGKVTCRAKSIKSLTEKLKMRDDQRRRDTGRGYTTHEEIFRDVKDLAGVRVILYTPNSAQRNKVREIVKEIWPNVEEKLHGNPRSHGVSASLEVSGNRTSSESSRELKRDQNEYVPRHLGYQAEHYRTLMMKHQQVKGYEWKEGDWVEIQVVSALGHAWAEAGHDVLYKTHAYGRPTITELRILDALSGLVQSGDLLLEQFRESVTKRTVKKWGSVHQFRMFLKDTDVLDKGDDDNPSTQMNSTRWDDFSDDNATDILFRFLRKTENNFPLSIRNILAEFNYPKDPNTKLTEELEKFESGLEITGKHRASFCVISKLFTEDWKGGLVNTSVHVQFSTMLDALILLQTFTGGSGKAKEFLESNAAVMNKEEKMSLDFVSAGLNRSECFKKSPEPYLQGYLDPAWTWFRKQAGDKTSLCGFFFRMAEKGVPAKELDNNARLEELKTGHLFGFNALGDEDD